MPRPVRSDILVGSTGSGVPMNLQLPALPQEPRYSLVSLAKAPSELEPAYELPLPRQTRHRGGVDESVTGGGSAIRVAIIHPGLRGLRIRRSRVVEVRTVKDVGELDTQVQTHGFTNPEDPPEGQIFERPTLLAEVSVIRAASKLTGDRVAPSLRIQNERRAGIEA